MALKFLSQPIKLSENPYLRETENIPVCQVDKIWNSRWSWTLIWRWGNEWQNVSLFFKNFFYRPSYYSQQDEWKISLDCNFPLKSGWASSHSVTRTLFGERRAADNASYPEVQSARCSQSLKGSSTPFSCPAGTKEYKVLKKKNNKIKKYGVDWAWSWSLLQKREVQGAVVQYLKP